MENIASHDSQTESTGPAQKTEEAHPTAHIKLEPESDESRDDRASEPVQDDIDRRRESDQAGTRTPQSKSSTRKAKPKSSSGMMHQRSPPNRYMPSYPPHGHPYAPPLHHMQGMHSGSHMTSSYPPPPHYYSGPPHDMRSMSHHYHMPPMPHHGQHGPYPGSNSHYCPPPGLSGRPGPPPGYHMPYPPPYPPPMGYPGGHMPQYAQGSMPPPVASLSSDSTSVASSKSKGSHAKSTKSQSTYSRSSHKKRTIDGVHQSNSLDHGFTIHRSNSTASSSSTVTTGNNTSMESNHPMIEESPQKRMHTKVPSKLPPLPHSSSNHCDGERPHRRTFSGTSTASTLSAGGFSLPSFDVCKAEHDAPIRSSPKRHKSNINSPGLVVDTRRTPKKSSDDSSTDRMIEGPESSRFQQLTVSDDKDELNLFMSLSTSPVNEVVVDSTPISKNTRKGQPDARASSQSSAFKRDMIKSMPSSPKEHCMSHQSDTPSPPISNTMKKSEIMTDEHTLNNHLRGQTFTPLPHLPEGVGTPPPGPTFSAVAPQLSWSIAGDTPSLEDLGGCSWDDSERDTKRPSSATSQMSNGSRGLVISPHSFMVFREENESDSSKTDGKEGDNGSMHYLNFSPHSDMGMNYDSVGGNTTPLPLFFESDEVENRQDSDLHSRSPTISRQSKNGDSEHIHRMFTNNVGRHQPPSHHHHTWHEAPLMGGQKQPTPLYAGSGMGFVRSPLHSERGDHHMGFFAHSSPYGSGPPAHHDRVRNLRGRMPPGVHLSPMPLHIPPPMSSHHPLTSPMGIPSNKVPMWSPHHGGMPSQMAQSPHHSQHPHIHSLDISQSKRKCVPLKPPIPSKFQGDMDKAKNSPVPEFTSLVNFPAHMSQKQAVNLPEGMRCCVMCGTACPCTAGGKKKAKNKSDLGRGDSGSDKGSFAIIPTQNKGLCTLCDVNVWIVVTSGLEIKWCKGCKNFRPWAAFGDKGLATKCLRCRERQREKYALQKEEKEKARLISKASNGL